MTVKHQIYKFTLLLEYSKMEFVLFSVCVQWTDKQRCAQQ
jgi:hypothetical protein